MLPESITVEGGLFPPDLLQRIAQGEAAADQRPRDFNLPRSARLADETQAAFSSLCFRWGAYDEKIRTLPAADLQQVTREALVVPLLELLGFGRLHGGTPILLPDGSSVPVRWRTHDAEDAAPVHIVSSDLDSRGGRRRSPAAELQELLDRSEAVWGILANGPQVRILRDSAGRSRRAWLQFDLKAMIEENAYADFALLYRLLHRTRFPWPEAPAHECPLERLYQQGIEEGGRVREKLRDGVKRALETLGGALLQREGNDALRAAIESGAPGPAGFYRELLNFVYRLLFLMVTEERKLLAGGGEPDKYAIFAAHYGIGRLRERADRQREDDDYADLWIGLRQTFRVCRDEDAAAKVGLSPLNGELFGEAACRSIEWAECPNDKLLEAVGYLSNYLAEGGRLRRVNYRHLDVEELGSVYESLLDYAPRISADRRAFHLAAGSERKQTGSYYTPPELVRELVDSALVPVMQERLDAAPARADKERALLDLRVCDPAAGSGHFLLAAARRIGDRLAEIRAAPAQPDEREIREARRDVVQQCIYAVDKNPLAVDLCKVALWIEAHAAGFPLSFLDHHVKHGDSLVGVIEERVLYEGIPDGAYNPVVGDEKSAANSYKRQNREERKGQQALDSAVTASLGSRLARRLTEIAALPQRTARQVREVQRRYDALAERDEDWYRLRSAYDIWTYAFFAPLQARAADQPDLVPTTDKVRRALAGTADGRIVGQAVAESEHHPYFHWALSFRDVMENGGFDVVLGNSPWERIKLQEKEFFGARPEPEARDVAGAPNKAARQRLIDALPGRAPGLAAAFEHARRNAESSSLFVRQSGRFPLAGRGDINNYAAFAELDRELISATGRVGMICPSGIAFDATTQVFFRDLVDSQSIASLFDFENREKVFPSIDSRLKFVLLTMSGPDRPVPESEFAFFLYHTEQLREPGNEARRIPLTREDFALFNPNTRTCPIFRSRRDMEVARKMYERAGVFWREANGTAEHNPWGVRFSTMFHMSNDSHLFRTQEQLEDAGYILEGNRFALDDDHYLPLYEAKLFHQFDHRFATFADLPRSEIEKGNTRELSGFEKADCDSVVIPRYWVHEQEVALRTASPSGGSSRREQSAGAVGGSSRAPTALDWLAERARKSLSGTSRGQQISERESQP